MITLFLVITTSLILLLFGFIITIVLLHQKKQLGFTLQLEKVKTNYEKELLKTQLEIQENTFEYISRDIHDNIGQFISLAKLQLNTLDIAEAGPGGRHIREAAELLTQALDDLRDLSRSLSSEIIRKGGLVGAVEMQVGQLRRLRSPKVGYELSGDYRFLDEQREIFILRILQEAVTNVLKHSGADTLDIRLSYGEKELALEICDNGAGLSQPVDGPGHGSGISNMKKRAEMIGGSLELGGRAGRGTMVALTVPYLNLHIHEIEQTDQDRHGR